MDKIPLRIKIYNAAVNLRSWLINHMSISNLHKKHRYLFKSEYKREIQYNKDIALAKNVIKQNRQFEKRMNNNRTIIYYPNGKKKYFD